MLTNNLVLPKLAQWMIIALAVIAVAVADVLIEKATARGNLKVALSSPWLMCAIGLYLILCSLHSFRTTDQDKS